MRRWTLPTAIAALLVGALAAGAGAAQQDVALQALNAQRAANGIPANVVDEPNADAGCAAHDSYMHRNNVFGHGEDPAKPGYSTLGDIFRQPYGEVLASGGGSFGAWQQDGVGPWESAPIHLLALLDPNDNIAGADESYGFDCIRMAHRGPVVSGFYSYPGDGRTGVAASEQASEWPYTPQEKAGLGPDATTGPNILLWGQCPPRQATLTGPDGPVPAVLVNYRQVPDFFYNDGDLIPVKPLKPLARYTVAVDWACGSQSFSFTTAGKANTLALDVDSQRADQVVLRARGGPDQAHATLSGPGGQRTVALHREDADLASKPLRLGAGHYRACVSSGGPGTLYVAATACQEFDLAGSATDFVTVSQAARRGQAIVFTVTAKSPYRGQRLRLDVSVGFNCVQRCTSKQHYTRSLVLGARQLISIPAPATPTPSSVHFATAAFRFNGAAYSGLDLFRDFR